MNGREHSIDDYFFRLEEAEKVDVLREAGLLDDRPEELRPPVGGSWGTVIEWMAPRRSSIVPALLRVRDLPYREIGRLIGDGDLSPGQDFRRADIRIRVTPVGERESRRETRERVTRVSLTDLAAASAMMVDVFMVVGTASESFDSEIRVTSPDVEVRSGSVEFNIGGGGLLTSGMALVVACAAGVSGLASAPLVVPLGGAGLVALGVIEVALGWKQKIAETRKTDEEARILRLLRDEVVIRQSRRERELNIKLKELELELAREQLRAAEPSRFASSSLVPRELVRNEAERLGLSESYANLLLNKALPTYLPLRRNFEEVKVEQVLRP